MADGDGGRVELGELCARRHPVHRRSGPAGIEIEDDRVLGHAAAA
jgi:hypothetical protein